LTAIVARGSVEAELEVGEGAADLLEVTVSRREGRCCPLRDASPYGSCYSLEPITGNRGYVITARDMDDDERRRFKARGK